MRISIDLEGVESNVSIRVNGYAANDAASFAEAIVKACKASDIDPAWVIAGINDIERR